MHNCHTTELKVKALKLYLKVARLYGGLLYCVYCIIVIIVTTATFHICYDF